MKALTISQPWADKIRSGEKFIENRSWSTPYRGLLAIHAGKSLQYLTKKELAAYDHSCVVGVAELVACVNLNSLRNLDGRGMVGSSHYSVSEVLTHPYTEGPWLWVLQNIRAIKPVAKGGAQGLWTWDVDIASLEVVEFKMLAVTHG